RRAPCSAACRYLVRASSLSPRSADPDGSVGNEFVRRHFEIERRRPAADAARGVVVRTVARAEPALEVALVTERHAAEMRADADHDQPLVLAFLDPCLVRLRIGK